MGNHVMDVLLGCLPLILCIAISQYESKLQELKMFEMRGKEAKARRKKKRILWSSVCQRISDKQFRIMFRMTRECFALLCSRVIISIGEKNFKSESCIDAFLKGKDSMFDAHEKTSGGYISGETKVGITLRLLAGGDINALGVLFDITPNHCTVLILDVLKKRI